MEKTRLMMLSGEKALHKACTDYLKEIKVLFYPIPSVKFGRQHGGVPIGYEKGMPDYCIPRWKFYFECKDPDTKHPAKHLEQQKKKQEELRAEGCFVCVIEDVEVFKAIISSFLHEQKKRVD